MNIGMLWFDNDPHTTFKTKVERAVEYYQHKYGRHPNKCLVHPSMLAEPLSQIGKVNVSSNRVILPGHLWIGEDDQS